MSSPRAATAPHTPVVRLLSLVAIFFVIAFVIPRPQAIQPAGWRLFAVFASTVAGLMLQPVPGGALVLVGVVLAALVGGLTMAQALSGFGDTTVWLVMAAFFISRSLIKTGLARRIALFFVRLFGRSTIGVCYALSLSDVALATVIPSNGARTGGVVLPILQSICELYGSYPGETAARLGSYLYTGVYQAICVSAAMFLTGQASNPLAAKMVASYGFNVNWANWFLAGLVPGAMSILVIPFVVLRLNPPNIRHTPEAAEFARLELVAMGPLSRNEWILSGVFAGVCGLWMTSSLHGIDITLTGLLGSVALLLTGVLTWEDVKNEKAAWDIFIWYGGLLMLGKALNDAKVPAEFARTIGAHLNGLGWPVILTVVLLIYFYAHYALASITAHMLAMMPAFLALLVAAGAPIGLLAFAFPCLTCFSAGLTNYGTTPAPMFFSHDYVSFRTWWRVGFVISIVNLLIWSTIGFGWWKLIGFW